MLKRKYNLNKMLEEIKEDDDLVDTSPTRLLSQDEIQKMLNAKKKTKKDKKIN